MKLRVGPNGYDDDSFYFANSFGTRPPDVDSVWVRVNGIDYGSTGPNKCVLGGNPMEPFKVTGVTMAQGLEYWTDHHSIIEYNDQ